MKALEKIKDMIYFCDAVGCHRALYESLKAVEAELEALQQPKSCEGCKSDLSYRQCKQDVFRPQKKDNSFCCNRHEPKEQ